MVDAFGRIGALVLLVDAFRRMLFAGGLVGGLEGPSPGPAGTQWSCLAWVSRTSPTPGCHLAFRGRGRGKGRVRGRVMGNKTGIVDQNRTH